MVYTKYQNDQFNLPGFISNYNIQKMLFKIIIKNVHNCKGIIRNINFLLTYTTYPIIFLLSNYQISFIII